MAAVIGNSRFSYSLRERFVWGIRGGPVATPAPTVNWALRTSSHFAEDDQSQARTGFALSHFPAFRPVFVTCLDRSGWPNV